MADPIQFDVFLYYPYGAFYQAYKLHCETIQIIDSRTPSIFPIPGVRYDTTGEPGAFTLDFGMMTEDVLLRGYLADTDGFVAGGTTTSYPYARWDQLEAVFRTEWRHYTMGTGPSRSCMIVYYDDAGAYYDLYVLPGRLHMTRGQVKAEWRFSATFHTVRWGWT